jgi:hypothetical protein
MTDRAIWLQSTDEKNTSFYLFHGYKVVDTVLIGNDNPDWHNAPVVIKIVRIAFHVNPQPCLLNSLQMIREPRRWMTEGDTMA